MNIGKGWAWWPRTTSSAQMFGATPQTDRQNYLQSLQIFGAYGRMVIPVDQDPGWATFEPDITVYGLDVFIRQVFNLGRDLAFNGSRKPFVAFNELPPVIRYGRRFLEMSSRCSRALPDQHPDWGVRERRCGRHPGVCGGLHVAGCKQTFIKTSPSIFQPPAPSFNKC